MTVLKGIEPVLFVQHLYFICLLLAIQVWRERISYLKTISHAAMCRRHLHTSTPNKIPQRTQYNIYISSKKCFYLLLQSSYKYAPEMT